MTSPAAVGSHRGAGATWCPSPPSAGSAASVGSADEDAGGAVAACRTSIDENEVAARANIATAEPPPGKRRGAEQRLAHTTSISDARRLQGLSTQIQRAAGSLQLQPNKAATHAAASAAMAEGRGQADDRKGADGGAVERGLPEGSHDERLWRAFMSADTDASGERADTEPWGCARTCASAVLRPPEW
eukprot:27743-Prymnesium_polylepis.2